MKKHTTAALLCGFLALGGALSSTAHAAAPQDAPGKGQPMMQGQNPHMQSNGQHMMQGEGPHMQGNPNKGPNMMQGETHKMQDREQHPGKEPHMQPQQGKYPGRNPHMQELQPEKGQDMPMPAPPVPAK